MRVPSINDLKLLIHNAYICIFKIQFQTGVGEPFSSLTTSPRQAFDL